MAYVALDIDVARWPRVEALIKGKLERQFFQEAHCLIRLPIPTAGIESSCAFALAHVLIAAVGGISTTLHCCGAGEGSNLKAFQKTLVTFYPWEFESNPPSSKEEKQAIAQLLWYEFRAPLTHHLGLQTKGQRDADAAGYLIKYERFLKTKKPDEGLLEEKIETLERAKQWPFTVFSETLEVRADAKVLKLERFYWGIRQMLVKLTQDAPLMSQAESFLAYIAKE
jgi:hypothetical protein